MQIGELKGTRRARLAKPGRGYRQQHYTQMLLLEEQPWPAGDKCVKTDFVFPATGWTTMASHTVPTVSTDLLKILTMTRMLFPV